MKNKKYNQGLSVTALVSILAVILVVAGGVGYFLVNNSSKALPQNENQDFVTSNNIDTNTINRLSDDTNQIVKPSSGKMCDYFSIDIAKAHLSTLVGFGQEIIGAQTCMYQKEGKSIYYDDDEPVAFFKVMGKMSIEGMNS